MISRVVWSCQVMTGRPNVPNSRYSYLTIDYIHTLTQTWDFVIIILMKGWILTHFSHALAPYQQIFYLPQMLQEAVRVEPAIAEDAPDRGCAQIQTKWENAKRRNYSKTPPDWGVVTQHAVNTPMGKRADSQLSKGTTKTWGIKAAGRSDEGINFFLCKQQGRYIISPCSSLTILAQLCSTWYSADVVRKTSGGSKIRDICMRGEWGSYPQKCFLKNGAKREAQLDESLPDEIKTRWPF